MKKVRMREISKGWRRDEKKLKEEKDGKIKEGIKKGEECLFVLLPSPHSSLHIILVLLYTFNTNVIFLFCSVFP